VSSSGQPSKGSVEEWEEGKERREERGGKVIQSHTSSDDQTVKRSNGQRN
jgi:hypothetical protein